MTNTAPIVGGEVPTVETRHRMRIALERFPGGVGSMAEYLGVSRQTVGNYLSGRTDPDLRTLRLWAMACRGVSLDWLRYGDAYAPGPDPNTETTISGYQQPVLVAA